MSYFHYRRSFLYSHKMKTSNHKDVSFSQRWFCASFLETFWQRIHQQVIFNGRCQTDDNPLPTVAAFIICHRGRFACRLHLYECTHISLVFRCHFFFFLHFVLPDVPLVLGVFLVEFCKVYGIANTSSIAPNTFYVLYWHFLFLLWLWHVWIYLIILICQTSIMSTCKMMYFVVLFLFLHFFGIKADLAWLK